MMIPPFNLPEMSDVMRQTKLPLLSNVPRSGTKQLNIPPRLLLGPGPSNVHARVLQALSTQVIGHLDPVFIQLMGEIIVVPNVKTRNRQK
jgi:hypothetical protein